MVSYPEGKMHKVVMPKKFKQKPSEKRARPRRVKKLKVALKKRAKEIIKVVSSGAANAVSAREKKMQDIHDQITGKKDID